MPGEHPGTRGAGGTLKLTRGFPEPGAWLGAGFWAILLRRLLTWDPGCVDTWDCIPSPHTDVYLRFLFLYKLRK